MSLPTQSHLHAPILEILNSSGKGGASVGDLRAALAGRFEMTPEEIADTVPSGRTTRLNDRSHWALSYLKRAGMVVSPKRAYWEITPEGEVLLSESEGREISGGRLRKMIEAKKRENLGETAEDDALAADEDVAPVEKMESLAREMEDALTDDLLDSVKSMSPAGFERLVVDLLEAMGYGEGCVVGGAGDRGVDGVINLDPLGVEKIYIQAKRWRNPVGEPEIRDFAGSLDLKGASKGVFITSSEFSAKARDAARSVSLGAKVIRLIDGSELARLMIRHGVGVVAKATYALQAPDENYFLESA